MYPISNSVSHSSIIHESDIDIDIDFKVCTTFAERHNNYIVPCTSMAATDHEPHEPSSDATVTYQVQNVRKYCKYCIV